MGTITKAEQMLKDLELDYQELVKDNAWSITPLDFLSKIKIVLVREEPQLYCMFIWKNETIVIEQKFKHPASITDVYSFLYSYDLNNFKNKKHGRETVYRRTM